MDYNIIRVTDDEEIAAVVELADQIWHQHFIPIIGEQQVDYMLDKFQSHAAIASQLESGFEYYIVQLDRHRSAYLGLLPDPDNAKMMISKLYVHSSARGRGVGSYLLGFVESECGKRAINTIWLTVNRFNHAPVNWYYRRGFIKVDEVKKDIGGGFVMDDFIMQKQLQPA